MKRLINRITLASLLLSLATAQGGEAGRGTVAAQSRPNIIIIMSDDMGFSDTGCYGGEINTPNLDSLAANGVRFTQFYNTARCCPTRAALLTGLYPHQAGVGHMMEDRGHDGYRGDLNRNAVTIAEVLRPAGYATYAVGKWHVTKKTRAESEADKYNWPLQHYFASVPKQTRDGWPVIMGPGVMPGPADTFIAYGQGWANVSNTPFREYKHWVHEGGVSTPLIAHWPKGIPAARRNKLVHDPGHLIDLMATAVDLAGAAYPKEINGQKIHPMEGASLRPVLTGARLKRAQPIFWEHEGNRAVRDGQWKLVAKENQVWELYDIAADRTEMRDLAAERPEKVKELSAKWDAWAARANVLPLGAWRASVRQAGK